MTDIEAIARQIANLQRQVERLSKSSGLAHSSIEDGAIEEYTLDGTLAQVIGKQFDGTHTVAVVTGPKPPTPTDPHTEGRPGGIFAAWDGLFLEDAIVPMDFARVELHVSITPGFTPSRATLVHVFDSPQGGEAFLPRDVADYYVRLVTRSQAGVASDPSGEVSATALAIVDVDAVVQEVLAQIPTGNGNLITYATVEPNEDGQAEGDTWWLLDGGQVAGLWRWDGETWIAQTLGNAVLAEIEAGKITTGTLAAGAKITAGDPTGARTEIDSFGLRHYDATGAQDVNLSSSGATFSGRVVGADVIGSKIRTATSGRRIEIDPEAGATNSLRFFTGWANELYSGSIIVDSFDGILSGSTTQQRHGYVGIHPPAFAEIGGQVGITMYGPGSAGGPAAIIIDGQTQIYGNLQVLGTVTSDPVPAQALGTSNLDDIEIFGTYYQSSSNNATAARNYPPTAELAGILEVFGANIGQGFIFQRYTTIGGNSTSANRGQTWVRGKYAGVWNRWRLLGAGAKRRASGTTTVSVSASTGNTRSITFPVGLFETPPNIQITKQSAAAANFIPYASNISTSGFTIGVYAGNGLAQTQTATLYWVAEEN